MKNSKSGTENEILIKKVMAIQIVCQYHPPVLGIVYKQGEKKKKMFKVQFNEMVQINDASKITQSLYRNYPLYINEENVDFEQVYNAVQLILQNQLQLQKSTLSLSNRRQSPQSYRLDYS